MTSTTPLAVVETDQLGRQLALPVLVWTEKVELAAALMAEGKPVRQTALECDVETSTIRTWLRYTDFQNRMIELAGQYRREVLAYSIARVECRVAAYQRDFDACEQIEIERGESEDMAAVPGGKTGRVCIQKRQIGKGKDAILIDEYKADTGLMKHKLEILKQAAQDLGQWSEKKAVTVDTTGPIHSQAMALAEILTEDQLKKYLEIMDQATGGRAPKIVDVVAEATVAGVAESGSAHEEFPA